VEGVGGVAAVGARVGERADDLQELHDRAGPAVGEDQGQRVRLRRADVHEVDGVPGELGGELREGVEPGLLLAPVVGGGPVGGQVAQVADGDAVAPADAGRLVGPAGARQPVAQVVQVGRGNVELEGPDRGVGLVDHEQLPAA
jgi:hypothetical protein